MTTHAGDARFNTTRWTLVLRARESDAGALEALCQSYWYPLYAFVRRGGHSVHDAQDLVQEFFSRLLEKHWLEGLDREKGRFRTFLMMAMKRFLANEWKGARRLKRGGGVPALSLDWDTAEDRYAAEPVEMPDEASVFDRRWALTLLERTLSRLEREQSSPGFFDALKPAIALGRGEFDCAAAAARLGMSEGALRVAVHRLRKRYREIFREEIAETVASPADVEGEIHYLVEVLARG